jgi:hypothetical protein
MSLGHVPCAAMGTNNIAITNSRIAGQDVHLLRCIPRRVTGIRYILALVNSQLKEVNELACSRAPPACARVRVVVTVWSIAEGPPKKIDGPGPGPPVHWLNPRPTHPPSDSFFLFLDFF